jgi:hypothetical protein
MVGWAEFEIENLGNEEVLLKVARITCQTDQGVVEIEKYFFQENRAGLKVLNPKKFKVPKAEKLPIIINFDDVEGSDRAPTPVNVEIEIVCNDSTYHGACPVTLSRRIPKRNR